MAMTAWVAKVSASSICLSVKLLNEAAHDTQHADWLPFAKQRNTEGCVHVLEARNVRSVELWVGFGVFDLNSLTRAERGQR